jgi:hypothetical protein
MHDRYWFPINLGRDAEYPQVLAGVVDNLKRYGDALQAVQQAVADRRAAAKQEIDRRQ